MNAPLRFSFLDALMKYDPAFENDDAKRQISNMLDTASMENESEREIMEHLITLFVREGLKYVGAPLRIDGRTVGVVCTICSSAPTAEHSKDTFEASTEVQACLHAAAEEAAGIIIGLKLQEVERSGP